MGFWLCYATFDERCGVTDSDTSSMRPPDYSHIPRFCALTSMLNQSPTAEGFGSVQRCGRSCLCHGVYLLLVLLRNSIFWIPSMGFIRYHRRNMPTCMNLPCILRQFLGWFEASSWSFNV
jgi:hypothetical protein